MANRFWVGGSGTWDGASTANWSATSGGAAGASAPVAADIAIFDANSGTGTCTTAAGATCSAVTFGSATVGLTLGAALTMTGTFTHTSGTITLQSFTLSVGQFVSSGTTARSIAFGTGNITLTGNNTTVWNTATSTGLTVSGTPVVNATYSGATGTRLLTVGNTVAPTEANAISFNVTAGTDIVGLYGGGLLNVDFTGFAGSWAANTRTIYGNLTISTGMTITGGTPTTTFAATSGTKTITTNGKTVDFPLTFNGQGGTFAFADALTMGARAFTITAGTVQLRHATTNTVGSFTTGAGTTQRFLQSTLAGTQATISDASGTNAATYLTIQDIAATGGATWNAFVTDNNVNAGNNSGWDFYTQSGAYMYNVRKSKRVMI